MIDVGYDGDVADVLYVFGQVTHFTMFTRCGLLTLICIASCAGQGDDERIVGHVKDRSGGGLTAFVRLTPDDGGPTLVRSRADRHGDFTLEHIKPGVYAVRMWLQGFREKAVHGVVVPLAGSVKLGSILLEISSCDGPGTNCDCAGSKAQCADSVVRGTYLVVKQGCGADLDAGKATCGNDTKTDFLTSSGEGNALYLRPTNGTLITPLNSTNANCCDAAYADKPLRIDGLGPGNDFCVLTTKQRSSHVFTADDVEPDSVEIKLWFVNRPR